MQSINYPTVAIGTERLRITPGPFHSDAMMGKLVNALIAVWQKYDLPFVSPNLDVDENFYKMLPRVTKTHVAKHA